MSSRRPKAPRGTFWRGDTLYGRARIAGRLVKWSLQTDNPKIAAERRKAGKNRVVAIKHGDGAHPFLDVLDQWSIWIAKQVGAATAERYACSLDQLSQWLDGKDQADIDGKLVGTIIAERGEAVSNATLRRDLTALSSVINYCILRCWRDANPVTPRMSLIVEQRDPIVLPQIEHINVAIGQAPGMIGAMMRAAMITGARQSELRLARRYHLDNGAGQLTVIGKGNKLRVIDLAPYDGLAFFNALPAYSEAQDRYLFWHEHNSQPKRYERNFKSNFAKFIDRVATWAAANGIEFAPFAFHHLRHWHAVKYLKDGVGDIYALKDRLGHGSITVTEGYLKYLTPDEARRAKFDKAGSPKSSPSSRLTGLQGTK